MRRRLRRTFTRSLDDRARRVVGVAGHEVIRGIGAESHRREIDLTKVRERRNEKKWKTKKGEAKGKAKENEYDK